MYYIELLPITLYSTSLFIFLNSLHKEGLLVHSSKSDEHGGKNVAVMFSQDIFDLFWLLVMWLPLTLFSFSFFSETLSCLGKDEVLLPFTSFLVIALIMGGCAVVNSTHNFNNQVTPEEPNVWSHYLKTEKTAIYRLYNVMEGYNCFILVLDVTLTFLYLYYTLSANILSFTLCTYSLISGFIFLGYFIMNALSKLTVQIKLGALKKDNLFPPWQIVIGVLIIFVLSFFIMQYLWAVHVYPCVENNLLFIITSILLPGIPIAIQLIQIASPLRKA